MGGICRVYIYCIPDFRVVVFQCFLFSIVRDFIVIDGIIVSRNCFGQIVCPLVGFVSIVQWKLADRTVNRPLLCAVLTDLFLAARQNAD